MLQSHRGWQATVPSPELGFTKADRMVTRTIPVAVGGRPDDLPRSISLLPGGTDDGLSESRRQLAVAFDSAPIGMVVTTDTGLMVRANTALAGLLGSPPPG